MALGLGFGCCCKGQCAELRNCDTLETITTTSDLSAYSVGVVLRRDASEGGGCWELLSLTAQCGDSPETFTVDTGPFTGETACADCLSGGAPPDGCQSCGDQQAFVGQPVPVQLWSANGQPTKMATYLGNGEWEVLYTLDCNGEEVEYKFTWQCFEGAWVYSVYRNGTLVLDKGLPNPAGGNTWSTEYEIPLGGPEPCKYDGEELQSFDLRWTFTPCDDPEPECDNCGFPALLGKDGTVSLDVFAWSGTIDGGPTGTAEYLGVVNLPLIGPTPLWRCTKTFRCGGDSFNITIDFYCESGQWRTNIAGQSVIYNGSGEFQSLSLNIAETTDVPFGDCVIDGGPATMTVTWNFEEC